MSDSVINSKILAKYFRELCQDFSPPNSETNTWMSYSNMEQNKKILHFLTQIKRLIKEGKCDEEIFKNEIFSMKHLSLEVLWYLEIAGVISLHEIIGHHERSDEDFVEGLSQKLHENILKCKSNDSKIRDKMVISYIRTAVLRPKSFFYQTLLRLITLDLSHFYQSDGSCEVLSEKIMEMSFLIRLLNKAELDNLAIKSFLTQVLVSQLQGSSQTIKCVFKKQEKFRSSKRNEKMLKFFTEICAYLDLNDLSKIIETEGCEKFEELNWDNMLLLITFVGTHYKDGWNLLKTLTQTLVQKSIQSLDVKLLSLGFLIARQGCFEKPNPSFHSYMQWFSSTFSSASKKLINSKPTSSFFFDFLSSLVPVDSFYYLKVHINRPPWVSKDCNSYLTDYINLVETQLNAQNISTELGICENPTGQNTASFDVEKVLKHFEKTNEVLNSVFQASMFCKDYFERKFLVELMSKFEGKRSARHKLIMKLHSLKKIPNSLFNAYKSLEKK